jgi:hypothetical protein
MIKGKIRITDTKTGKLLHQQDMHSFVENFIKYMFNNKFGITGNYSYWLNNATPIVGDGTTAEVVTQTALASQITTFTESEITRSYVTNENDITVTISKTFTNNTGATITIKELGIYSGHPLAIGLYIRDLLDSANYQDVLDGNSITVFYDLIFAEPFTRNIGLLAYYQSKESDATLYQYDGATCSIAYYGCLKIGNVGIGDFDYGITIGTDSTPMSLTDNDLGARITSGWFFSEVSGFTKVDEATGETSGWITRHFTNNTGADVKVKEVGLAGMYSSHRLLLLRYLTNGITVADGETLQVVLKIKTTM